MPPQPNHPRKFISVNLRCAGIYMRFYETKDGKAFYGHCAKCCQSFRIDSTQLQPGTDKHIVDCGRNRRPI